MDGDEKTDGGKGANRAEPPAPPQPPQDPPKNGGEEAHEPGSGGNAKPSQFDQQLRTTDVFIAVFAGLSTLAAGISAAVAIWTALQMQASSAQTDSAINKLATLADQTKRQADQSQRQADAAQLQIGQLSGEVAAINRQADAAGAGAAAAQGQLAQMQDEQRPDIDIQSAAVASPLVFNSYGAHLRVAFNLRNVGKTIGAVSMTGKFIIKTKDGEDISSQLNICRDLATAHRATTIYIPAQSAVSTGLSFGLAPDRVDIWRANYNPPIERIVPMIVGCIDYPYRGHHFQRGFIYELDKPGADQFTFDVLDPRGDVPQNQVVLATNPRIAPYIQ